ncbi:MAG: hypothetical protein N3E52_03595 [Candidatus Bathyarchaeota archaeon]|nr:hypothetical protein [Candidatus Bathyarchaeota archaeon]
MRHCGFHYHKSGQVLIIVSLIITLLILSTATFVIKTEENHLIYNFKDANAAFSAYHLGLRHTITSALANVSNGGHANILVTNLNRFASAAQRYLYNVIFSMESAPADTTPYQNGFWINWTANGKGISSAYVNFRINASGLSIDYSEVYSVNVTSEVYISGAWTQQNNLKVATVTCTVLNEGKPALAQNFTIYFEKDGSLIQEEWIQAESPSVIDHGNGTYSITFTAETINPDGPLIVSLHCHDLRGILIKANVTCTRL